MKGFFKAVVWIVIVVAALVGVYFVLPEYPQDFVKSVVQPIVDAESQVRVQQVQSLLVKELDNASYKTILEAKSKNPCWAYEKNEETGVETVTFHGRGLTINLKDWTEYSGLLSTNATVKVEFVITGGKQVDIHTYVDDTLMEIVDAKDSHQEENKKIRLEILKQVYLGSGLEG
ncbi:MAG: hypothetical protein J6C01_06350 [Lachnospiraceae bacterium]|nr:hypothetical protein [Lachnospiraceae bacterium]